MPVTIEKVAWGGWENCRRIANGEVELIVTSDVGPRVMRYGFTGSQNLFLELPDQLGGTGEQEMRLRGGHRLWAAPEDARTTYAPDNLSVEVEVRGSSLDLLAPPDASGLQKQMLIRMASVGTSVLIVHSLANTLAWPIEVSPWAVTMMAPGGTGITGFPSRGTSDISVLPTHPLAMWAYTDFSDLRWKFGRKYLTLSHLSGEPSTKAGLFHPRTWGAYLLGQELFLKRCEADATRRYPDLGCSFEMYADGSTLELETLGPLTRLEPGQRIDHVERWSLTRNVQIESFTDEELDRVVEPLL